MTDTAHAASTTDLLAAVPLFSSLDKRQLKLIAQTGKEHTYPAGQLVIHKGDKGIGFFLILDGEVEVEAAGHSVASLHSGQFFGEMALLDDQPRTADVRAKTATRCLILSAWEFWGSVGKDPELIRMLLKETVHRLRSSGPGLTE
jgi:CRP-like cAMP-binding protein